MLRQGQHLGINGGSVSGNSNGKKEVHLTDGDPRRPRPIPFDGLVTNKLLTALPGADFARLLPHLEPVWLLPGQEIYKTGEQIDFVYFPENAVFSHVYFFSDGGTTGAALIGNDGMVGLSAVLNSGRSSHWTRVTISGNAVRARPEIIKQEFARGQAMHQLLLDYTHRRLIQLSQKAVCNGYHRLEERLCSWLLMVHDRSREGQLSLTHEQIACYLGARRAGITSACNKLRSRGTIEYRRGLIRIRDRAELEKVACECYQALSECFSPYPSTQ
ncbi:MAG: Crp/Fnr family transcriptional regulator [Pyrinomonadaceae bacterium]